MKLKIAIVLSLALCINITYSQSKKKRAKNEARMIQGLRFLSENGKRPEVTTLLSGLQYEIIQQGEGPKPVLTSQVTTHYHGTLINGNVFDSSVARGSPANFPVNGVIKGWTEALQLMSVGSKWKLYIPYHLAYGEKGTTNIKPFSTLVFEVELLDIR